jgi:hypothetical protein
MLADIKGKGGLGTQTGKILLDVIEAAYHPEADDGDGRVARRKS